MENKRLEYFDSLKGVAIFLVVMGHVVTYCMHGIDSSFLFRLVGIVHMPLFFFISGWFSFRNNPEGLPASPSITKRFCQLIVPMLVVGTLWIWYYPYSGLHKKLDCSFIGFWGNMWKNGYWFLLVLFEISLIYVAFAGLIRWHMKKSRRIQKQKSNRFRIISNRALPYLLFLIFYTILATLQIILPYRINSALSVMFTFKYFPVFMFGVWCSAHARSFAAALEKSYVYTASISSTLVLGILILYPQRVGLDMPAGVYTWRDAAQTLFHISLAVLSVAIARSIWCEYSIKKHKPSVLMRLTSKLGRISLSIYMLHYFFLFPMNILNPLMKEMGLALIPLSIVACASATVIIMFCYALQYIISRSGLLGMLILGITPTRNAKRCKTPFQA